MSKLFGVLYLVKVSAYLTQFDLWYKKVIFNIMENAT